MTANDAKLLNDSLRRRAVTINRDDSEGMSRLADAVIVGEKERSSGCFPAVSAVLVIAATIAAGVMR